MKCGPSRIVITVGEDKSFKIFLREEETGNPLDLSSYTSGKIVFCNCNKVKIEKTVAIPGLNPASGEIAVTLIPAETSQFDDSMTDMQIELTDGTLTKIVVIKNKLEVIEQIC